MLISFRSKFAVRNAFRAALAMASRRTITIKDGEKLRKMAASLQITLDELTYLENTRRAGVKQAAIPTAMALARINLVLQLAVERKLPKE
jgi:hypothetical protein